ncbi:metalloregulator ArsR/SmtB family transcription factor [Lentzea sp. NPDC051838]|uniref:metalloregulator ArsR/SmtB family transcription factor n=1 Tax=Lentzea sp. NPDC051838 TaxID=3154849 RepID=UPI003439F8D6
MADPLRWRIARELAVGDRRVRELVAALGQPQNLVSYHLKQLRDAGLVTARRSSFDGRDSYYHLDLGRYAAAWEGVALSSSPVSKVLFVCTGNSGRSPMAEALLRHRAGHVEVRSAGSQPKPLHPNAIKALKPYGITVEHEPTHLDAVRRKRFDLVITLCDRVREVLPAFAGKPRFAHWSIADPAHDPDPDTAFQRTAEELDGRIRLLEV